MHDSLMNTVIAERYLLTNVVGRGGMGVVYRAEDKRLNNRPCAVKLLTRSSLDAEEDARFDRELNIITLMRSAHVVQVLDTGNLDDGRRFIVMELLEGYTLSDLVKQGGALSPARTMGITRGILAGLSEAHEHGIVHRDLKPANIFICRTRAGDEVAKILDFGIAKESHGGGIDLTAASMLIGTPKYMAPEQFLKKTASPQTDLYSVGLLVYEMLNGEPPFTRRTLVPDSIKTMPDEFRVGWLHVNQEPIPVGLTNNIWPIVHTLLAKDPEDRYTCAAEVLEALAAAGVRRAPPPPPPPPLISRELDEIMDPSASASFPVAGETLGTAQVKTPSRNWVRWGIAAAAIGAVVAVGIQLTSGDGASTSAASASSAQICRHALISTPPGADVLKGVTSQGKTPITIERPCDETWLIQVALDGYTPKQHKLSGKNPLATEQIKMVAAGARPEPSLRAAEPERPAARRRPVKRPPKRAAAPAPKRPTPARKAAPARRSNKAVAKPKRVAPKAPAPKAAPAKSAPQPAPAPKKPASNALPF